MWPSRVRYSYRRTQEGTRVRTPSPNATKRHPKTLVTTQVKQTLCFLRGFDNRCPFQDNFIIMKLCLINLALGMQHGVVQRTQNWKGRGKQDVYPWICSRTMWPGAWRHLRTTFWLMNALHKIPEIDVPVNQKVKKRLMLLGALKYENTNIHIKKKTEWSSRQREHVQISETWNWMVCSHELVSWENGGCTVVTTGELEKRQNTYEGGGWCLTSYTVLRALAFTL